MTSAPLARVLGVAEKIPKGVLLVGANPVAQALGLASQDCGFRPQVVQLHPFAEGNTVEPDADWKVLSLIQDTGKIPEPDR